MVSTNTATIGVKCGGKVRCGDAHSLEEGGIDDKGVFSTKEKRSNLRLYAVQLPSGVAFYSGWSFDVSLTFHCRFRVFQGGSTFMQSFTPCALLSYSFLLDFS